MPESTYNLQTLTIRPANKGQREVMLQRITAHWGSAHTGLEYFTRLHDLLETKEYASDGKLIYWVLVPKDNQNTLDFYSSCRTYRREVLVLRPGHHDANVEVGYAISAVLTSPEHRGQGYAHRMMSLIHHALAPHLYPNSSIQIPPSVKPATMSVLYSDIGNYYERCGPSPGELGWRLTGPLSTTWKIGDVPLAIPRESASSCHIIFLSQNEVRYMLASDTLEFKKGPDSASVVQFAFPSASPNIHLVTRSAANPMHIHTPFLSWGAYIPSEQDFITWSFNYGPPHELQINRLKASPKTLPVLLRAAFEAGKLQECETAEAWNVPSDILETAELLGGITTERKEHLPALRWYGPEQTSEIQWVRNEQYAWC